MPSLLLCPPEYFAIEYEINPWMDRKRPAHHRRVQRQWEGLRTLLEERMGAHLEFVPPAPGLPDMCFTANAGLVCGDLFISSRFRYPARTGESPHFEAWFQDRGFRVIRPPEGCYFEGEGDAFPAGDNIFTGYHFRSEARAHLFLSEVTGKRVLPLELIDPRFYHLDTCFCPLDEETLLYYPKAFDAYGRRVIAEHFPNRIEASDADALRFGCNAVVMGCQVALNAGCLALKNRVEALGWRVWEQDLSEFLKSGGAAKCLALYLTYPYR